MIKQVPRDVQSRMLLCRILRLKGETKEPEELLKEIIQLNPKHAWAIIELSILFATTGRLEEAEPLFRKIVQINPYASNYANFALVLRQLDRHEEAEAVFREAVQRWPESAWILNGLADHLAVRGIKLDEALELALRAVQAEPKHPYYVSTLGEVHLKRGEYELAEVHLSKAIELFGKDPTAAVCWVYLGAVYEKKNEIEKAKDAYGKALSIQPDNKEAAEALKRLGGQLFLS